MEGEFEEIGEMLEKLAAHYKEVEIKKYFVQE